MVKEERGDITASGYAGRTTFELVGERDPGTILYNRDERKTIGQKVVWEERTAHTNVPP
jgi:hypothetical protein